MVSMKKNLFYDNTIITKTVYSFAVMCLLNGNIILVN